MIRLGGAYNPHTGLLAAAREAIAERRCKHAPRALIYAAPRLLRDWTVMDRLGEIRAPTLVVAGRDDFLFPPEHQAQLAAGIPYARLRIIERAGHNPHSERPDEVLGVIRDFLPSPGGRRRLAEVMDVRTAGLITDRERTRIPPSHRDLAECPPVAALTTVTADGYPQTSVVWCDFDGAYVRVNTMRDFAKARNMRRNPLVTLLCYDPRQPLRYLEIRGTVIDMTEAGAGRHLDELASKYAGRPIRYFGDAIPARFAATETPVLCRIRPTHVVALDATGPGGAR